MSKLQRHGHLTGRSEATTPCPHEDEMYEVVYLKVILPDCSMCKHYHGRAYGGVELVCVIHPYGYSGDSCRDRQLCRVSPYPQS